MSSILVGKAKRVKVGDRTAKLLLLILSDYADDEDRAWPSVERLMLELEASERTIQRALRYLEQHGLIVRDREYGTRFPANRSPYVYRVTIADAEKVLAPAGKTKNRGATHGTSADSGVPTVSLRGDTGVVSEVPTVSLRGATSDTQTLIEHLEEHSESVRARDGENPIEQSFEPESADPDATLASSTDPLDELAGMDPLDDWTPDPTHVALAAQYGLDLTGEASKWRDHVRAGGHLPKDLDAAFRNWLRRAPELGLGTKPATTGNGPSKPHKHSYGCQHVLHALRRDTPDPDELSCRLADMLNAGMSETQALANLGLDVEAIA